MHGITVGAYTVYEFPLVRQGSLYLVGAPTGMVDSFISRLRFALAVRQTGNVMVALGSEDG